ncbi:MAG: FecR domain-containing protein, partial [Rhizobiaceae bacterium]
MFFLIFHMNRIGAIILLLYFALLSSIPSFAAQDVGKTATIKGSVTGSVQGKSRRLAKGKPVYLNERIKARSRSTGQFILLDNSKIAVGEGATVVLDKFLVSRGKKAKKVSLNVLRGALRFSSGRSGSKAYKIVTPTATLGVRGTLFDVSVVRGVTSVLLLRGSVDVCGSRGCSRLTDRCSYAIARRGRAVQTGHTKRGRSNARDVDPDLFPFAHSQRG